MFKDSTTPVRWIGNFILFSLLLVSAAYTAVWWQATQNQKLIDLYAPAYLTTTEGDPLIAAHPGQWVVINFPYRRQPQTCWAEYLNLLQGPVNFQYPATRTSILVDKVTDVVIKSLYKLPEGLPEGAYKWRQIVYPKCNGFDVQPYELPLNLTFIVTK